MTSQLKAFLILILILLSGCEDSKRLPGQPDEDDQQVFNSAAVSSVIWSGKAYGIRNGGRLAWRVPERVNSSLPKQFRVCFPNDKCYLARNYAGNYVTRYPNGVTVICDNPARRTSHGGVYIHAAYGYRKSKMAYITR